VLRPIDAERTQQTVQREDFSPVAIEIVKAERQQSVDVAGGRPGRREP
jgi:hypothetical protein